MKIAVEEMTELAEAAELGFRCPVVASSRLLAQAEARAVLERVRDALRATEGDPGTSLLRGLALRGEWLARGKPVTRADWERWWDETRRFGERMRAGIGGVSERGDLLALHVGSVFVLCVAVPERPSILGVPPVPPRVVVTLADSRALDPAIPFAYPRLARRIP